MLGGVAPDNYASQRILEKNGFKVINSSGKEGGCKNNCVTAISNIIL